MNLTDFKAEQLAEEKFQIQRKTTSQEKLLEKTRQRSFV
jgi:hypothetical protein